MQYSASVSQRIQQAVKSAKQLQAYDSHRFGEIIKEIVSSEEFENWIVLRELLENSELKSMPRIYECIVKALDGSATTEDQSFPMLVFIYGWVKETNTRVSMYKVFRMMDQFVQQGKLSMFTSWLSEADITQPEVAQTITMMTRYLPLLITQQSLKVQIEKLQVIIQLICHAHLNEIRQFQEFDRLCLLVKRFNFPQKQHQMDAKQFENSRQNVIIKTVIEVLANIKNCTGNGSWLFLESILFKKHVQSFVYSYAQNILLLTENQLVNIFSKLFESSLQENTLVLFSGFTRALKNQEKFYEMKILYQKIVLPILIRRGKAKFDLTKQVLDIGALYVIGFYEHCDIGVNGMICLLSNVEKIDQKAFQRKWIELAFLVAQKNMKIYEPMIFQELTKQGLTKKELQQIKQQSSFGSFEDLTCWQITKRNSNKLKTYPRTRSKDFKGIQNNGVQCYIISVMQALFTTQEFARILKKITHPPRDSLIFQLKALFSKLSQNYDNKLTVEDIRREGPADFAISERQEDAQQYLLKVFEMIEEDLEKYKERNLLADFHKTFKSKITRKLECQKCQHIIDKDEEQFIHTISNRVSLREKQVEQISDYKCEKCKQTKFLNRIQLHPTSTIFIVHFNRFSFKNGESGKQLETQSILRDFMGYKLVGMVFHIGKKVEFGHYVYYFCCGGKKWMEMNDSNVMEFELENEDEEFERQMKAEMTPYILFYAKK